MTDNASVPLFTSLVAQNIEEIKNVFGSDRFNLREKEAHFRSFFRKHIQQWHLGISYSNLNKFLKAYDRGEPALIQFEGPGARYRNIIFLTECPSVPLIPMFTSDDFIDRWKKMEEAVLNEYHEQAVLSPLCVIHQAFRNVYTSYIGKGNGIVQAVTVACRSTQTGKVVLCKRALDIAGISNDTVLLLIKDRACAYALF